MISRIVLIVFGLQICWKLATAKEKSYNGYRVIKIETAGVNSSEIAKILRQFQLDEWRHPSRDMPSYDVMISPHHFESVTDKLRGIGAKYTTTISDVQKLIDAQKKSRSRRRQRRSASRFSLKKYHSIEEIRRWVKHIARSYPEIVRLVQVGMTYRGHRIIAAKMGVPRNTTKKIIWQDGVIHAREWITGASLLWIMKKIARGYREGDPEIRRFLEEMDWYILPVWNVDGYKYTWNKDRMWRKSRSSRGPMGCYGVDLNRNFPTSVRGLGTASDYACSEVYHGQDAFSEIESLSVGEFLLKKKGNIAAMITLHSYAQYWLYPYGYKNSLCDDYIDLFKLSKKVVEEMRSVHGTYYIHGTVSELAYKVSGGSIDWSYDDLCVKYTFAVELRDTGQHGFILPPSQIIPTAEEYFKGLKVVANHVIDLPQEELTSGPCKKYREY